MTDEAKRGPGRPPKPTVEATVNCVVLRDFWDEAGERHCAGTIVALSIPAAMDGIEAGAVRRDR